MAKNTGSGSRVGYPISFSSLKRNGGKFGKTSFWEKVFLVFSRKKRGI